MVEPSAIPDPPANRREAVMEDRRTQHTLDALADLYLTGVPNDPIEVDPPATPTPGAAPSDTTVTPPNGEATVPPAAPPATPPATPPTAVPTTAAGNLAQHPLHGPPPFKLHPRPAAKAAPGEPGLSPPPAMSPTPAIEPFPAPVPAQPPTPAVPDAFDTLDPEPLSDAETAALLGDASSFPPREHDAPTPNDLVPTPPPSVDHDLDPNATPAPAPPGSLTVMTEAVVVGNLPGPSGAWVSQYAQSLAEQEGPVVLVHLDRHEADFELVRPRQDAPEPRDATPRRPLNPATSGQPAPPTDPIALLDHAIHHPDHPARSVLVRIDPSTDLDDLARLADLDAWTLATGPDEFATAAAVQLVDRLLVAYPEAADTALGLMVLGADQPAAIDAANRVANQLGPRLAHPVELLGYQKQMLPVRISQLGRAPADAHTWTRLLDWLEQHAPPEPDDARPQPAPRTTFLAAEPAQPIDEPDTLAIEEPQPAPEPETKAEPQPVIAAPPSVEPTPAPPVATHNASLDTIESRRDTIRRRWLDRLTPTPTRTAPPDGTPAAEAAEPPAQPAAAEPTPPAEPLAATPAAPIVAPEPTPEPEPVPAPTSVEPIAEEPAATAAPAPPPEPPPAKPRRARPTRPALDAATPPRATQPPPITPRVAPTPTPTPTPVPTAATTDIAAPDLAQFLADRDAAYAGSITLEAACPRHPDTEVILDQAGQLHLLARHDSTDPSPQAPDLDAALVGLLETRQWAIDHLDLIALTQRQARFDRATAPDIHLFTDDARAATRLADRVGPMLHLHLLQPVTVGRETTWFCTPLT